MGRSWRARAKGMRKVDRRSCGMKASDSNLRLEVEEEAEER